MATPPGEVTRILRAWGKGDQQALEKLMPVVYGELRRLAQHYLRRERPDHTLQATALVHEAYLRLVDQRAVTWQNRAHFFGVAAQLMRRILVDHARRHHAAKRGGTALKVSLNDVVLAAEERAEDLVALDDALNRLAAMDPRQGRVVELRLFGGLTVEETAEVLRISPATVKREWTTAKAWLSREIRQGSRGEAGGLGQG
ncbi:MAG: sigma-70 family RNA polymerase sigma factor [Candidatus Eisenbacteria bacterium]|uniref:Sigma-70 family RNA polymerase sigma factor n=1 Tax=Eiseniibacteriota bacterium TaxID=2212470 RepID=A0A538STX7_UNCEI|nr:MAG: sigma-70 family RNA polymerase sigma factor [Candidatus Eisenbacteria bacterium]